MNSQKPPAGKRGPHNEFSLWHKALSIIPILFIAALYNRFLSQEHRFYLSLIVLGTFLVIVLVIVIVILLGHFRK